MSASKEDLVGALRRAAKEVAALKRRNAELTARKSDPVVVVGMGCRYPGGVVSPGGLWDLVRSGGEGIGGFPSDRGWDVEGLFDPDPDVPGKSYVRRGGFLADVAGFDAGFFGISPAEVGAMDPQQRLMLEVCWEAVERAGIDPLSLRGSRTGVFAGVMGHDYGRSGSADGVEGFGTGVMESVVSGRVSYVLGLEGPAVSVDTACSSSLVALHLAAQALRAGECDLALAGGVTVMATPETFVEFSRQRGLAVDGRCKAFAEGADGTGWGEGVGVLLLERLSDARRNGHPVLAVVAGSAVNQDGASNGLTAPNGPSQQRVIRAALASAGLSASDVDAVEAHGTGTVLGDPIEAQALLATYGQRSVDVEPLWLGSLKSNVGHTQAAAGVGGVIKMVEALRRAVLPRTLHVDAPSSHVDWSAGRVELLTAERAWPVVDRPRRAGVSSFGLSGTNAHVIVEQAPEPDREAESEVAPPASGAVGGVWTLSAKTPDALAEQAAGLADWVGGEAASGFSDADVALSLSRRSVFGHRAVVFGADRGELLAGLADLAGRGEGSGVVAGSVRAGGLAFVFPGQGAQWLGMGRELAGAVPEFARELEVVAGEVDRWWGHRLLDVVWGSDAGVLERTEFTQPALFALEVALFRLLEARGVRPDFVVGHSVGEIAAAHVVGMLSLEDAARLVVARGRVMQRAEAGVMTAVSGSLELVEGVLAGVGPELGPVVVAAVNAPGSVVISGAGAAVDAAVVGLEGVGCRTRSLAVSHAFHSPLLDPVLEEFEQVARQVRVSVPAGGVGLVSNVTGELADVGGGFGSAEYWVRHARQAVRFADAVTYLAGQDVCRFAELGPGTLVSAVVSTLDEVAEGVEAASVVPLLSRRGPESTAFVAGLGQLYVSGVPVSWAPWCAGGRLVDLPTYAFQRERYWLTPTTQGTDVRSAGLAAAEHPLLGAVVASPGASQVVLTGRLSRSGQPWLAEHEVFGHVMVPASALVELAVRAGDEVGCPVVRELAMTAPLLLPERGGVQLHVVVGEPDEAGRRSLEIHSRTGAVADDDRQGWVRHAQGVLAADQSAERGWPESVWPPVGAEAVDVETAYERLAEQGYEYGPVFRGVRAAWRRGGELFAEVSLSSTTDVSGFGVHPALLDAVVHAPRLAARDAGSDVEVVQVPFLFEDVSLRAVGASSVRVRFAPAGSDAVSVHVADESGALVLEIGSLATRPVSPEALTSAAAVSTAPDGLFEVVWSPVPLPERATEVVEYAGWDPDAESVPPVVVWEWAAEAGADVVASMHSGVHRALEVLQAWLTAPRYEGSTLMVVTRGAVGLPGEAVADVAASAVWGLVRSAQSENPGRIVLVDTDGEVDSALAQLEEPQLVLRDGIVRAARLVRAGGAESVETGIGADGAVIVTGGTGGVGGVLARRLVQEHGAGCVVLASRRGEGAEGVSELVADLEAAGAVVRVVACDVSDRAAVVDLVASVPDGFELRGVVHAAGVLDDGVIGSLTAERLDRVLAAKADAAWYLHEATLDRDVVLFSVVSSLSGVLGGPGQGNYAAANTFLDALAVHRRDLGLAGQSVSWGLWADAGGMGAGLADESVARLRAGGVLPLGSAQAVELFDAALSAGAGHVVATRWDLPALRRLARAGELAPVLAELVPAVRRTAATGESVSQLVSRLRGIAPDGRRALLTELVSSSVAAVLGYGSPDAVAATAAFRDLGLDSLGGVNVRNSLQAATGLSLPASLVFDYPTAQALAHHLLERLLPGDTEAVAVTPVIPSPSASGVDSDPVVVVGMGCRYPGGVVSPGGLWDLVRSGGEGIGGFPSDRGWDVEGLFDPDPDVSGKSYVRRGGFLADVAGFDAGFFGVSPREAVAMDPQQRLLLEVCWEAIERAGVDPQGLRGSRTGVFAGVMSQDYAQLGNAAGDVTEGFSTGLMGSVVSGRVSYVLGLEGPAVSVDTACSSSLVALHLAGQALRAGECDLALAGGVTVMATPETFVEFSRQRGLAVDGRCKAFAEGADGTGWGEGVGVLLLERLSDARRNGHPVLAVVAGSAVNQDGASNGLTAPNGPSQQRVIRAALASAGLSASDVDAVEAHGTGTVLGDPIEAQALLATYGQRSVDVEPLWLGSLKSNVGHTQAAAGVGGVIKMIEALRHGTLPRTLHVDAPSSHVDWTSGRVELLTAERAWPAVDRPRRAGVSSFGLSGTNAHVIIEQAPDVPVDAEVVRPEPGAVGGVWALSAKTPDALANQASALAGWLRDANESEAGLRDVALSLSRRSVFGHRAVVFGADRGELLAGLADLAGRGEGSGVVAGTVRAGGLAFVFPGQGAQWLGMGRELAGAVPEFARELAVVAGEVDRWWGHRLLDVVWGSDAGVLERTEFTQPALFALEVALFRVVASMGVRPDFVVGHSVGEIAAAHVVGMLSLEDAARLVVARGRVMQRAEAGVMTAVSGSLELVEEVLAGVAPELGPVVVAAVNAPRSVVISGAGAAVDAAVVGLEGVGCRTRSLAVSHAFHSPLLDPVLEEFEQVARQVRVSVPAGGVGLVSNVTGELADVGGGFGSAEYWVRHARQAVRFADAVTYLGEQRVSRFVELGPGVLVSAVVSTLELEEATAPEAPLVVPLLSRRDAESAALVSGLGQLFASGVPVSWEPWCAGGRLVDLPTYAFQRERYWLTPTTQATDVRSAGLNSVTHPMLGAAVALPGSTGLVLTGQLSRSAQPWLADHDVLGHVMVPASALVELAVRAGDEVGCPVVRELAMTAPLLLPERGGVQVHVVVGELEEDALRTVEIHSRPDAGDGPWTLHAQGTLVAGRRRGVDEWSEPVWPPVGAEAVDVEASYQRLAKQGYEYGPLFQGVRAVWRRGEEVLAEVSAPAGTDVAGFGIHPALLDAVVHAPLLVGADEEGGPRVPFLWEGASLHAVGALSVRVRIVPKGGDAASVQVVDESGALVLSVDSLVTRQVSQEALAAAATATEAPDGLFEVAWREVPVPAVDAVPYDVWDPDAEVVPPVVVWEWASEPGAEVVASMHSGVHRALEVVQSFLVSSRCEKSTLLVVTKGAVSLAGGAVTDAAASGVWGLVRSAQSENPGRIVLIDTDDEIIPAELLALSEPQVLVRGGVVHVPRLARATMTDPVDTRIGADGAVIVTGGTGGVGSVLARRLVAAHEAGCVVLASRRGAEADGVAELVADLEAAGAVVRVVACDVSDRAAVVDLVGSVPEGFELRGVVHAAGVLDDGVIGSLTPERLDRVLAAKADAAWYLHEATRDLPLNLFSVVSSLSGVLGGPGQANYAAANAFLDALAVHRRHAGLPGQSTSWGLWAEAGGMGDGLADEALARLRTSGVLPLSSAQAVELFDAATSRGAGHLIGVRWDLSALRRLADADELAPLLADLVPTVRRTAAAGESVSQLETRLRETDLAGRHELLSELVSTSVAAALGHSGTEAVPATAAFRDLGLDSLGGVNVRNRLQTATGLTLPASLVFDYPTPQALAGFLLEQLMPGDGGSSTAPTHLTDVRRLLQSVPISRPGDSVIIERLLKLAEAENDWSEGEPDPVDRRESIEEMDVDALIDMGLGLSQSRKSDI